MISENADNNYKIGYNRKYPETPTKRRFLEKTQKTKKMRNNILQIFIEWIGKISTFNTPK